MAVNRPLPVSAVANGQADELTPEMLAELKRVMARGTDIVLANGDTVAIVFKAKTMIAIEAEYGSLNAYLGHLQGITGGKIYTLVAWTIAQILRISTDDALDLLDTRRLADYSEAIVAAVIEAMPQADEALGNLLAAAGTNRNGSPGAASSTSPSPNSTSSRRRSGT